MATDVEKPAKLDQERLVRSLTELFADEEGIPLIDYASTLHQLSQRDDDSFRSSEETTSDFEDSNALEFMDAQEFWKTFALLLSVDRNLSTVELDALKSEVRYQHQRNSQTKPRRKSSIRRRKVYRAEGEVEVNADALVAPVTTTTTTTTRLRVRKISKSKDGDSNDSPVTSRGRSPSSSTRRNSLPRRASSRPRRNSISDVEILKCPSTPNARASSRSKGRTRRLSIGKSPRRMYDTNKNNEGTEDEDDNPDPVPESPKIGQLYLSSVDVEKIKQAMVARTVKVTDEKPSRRGSWLDTPKALIGMALPGGSKPSSPKSPNAYKPLDDPVISWVRVAPPSTSILRKKSSPRRSSTTSPAATPPTHSRNNSGDLTPHAKQLHAIPMGSLYSFKSGYDT
ncbi:hypothetical protein FisN_24Lh142 [Fistulifera solaris]|uniref:Uncharacterized protein n=1 Tax=Fistulifera solaris TaxID=1519565 RepID=A0A1Z5K9E3_FISSO|nr:hypothetical protein FisN_24Lh142 [Fistulifera solaris]|eukprot:GAX22857.1 hypothetical protein FisN_24Lh142 [Fistulifera solaris]